MGQNSNFDGRIEVSIKFLKSQNKFGSNTDKVLSGEVPGTGDRKNERVKVKD